VRLRRTRCLKIGWTAAGIDGTDWNADKETNSKEDGMKKYLTMAMMVLIGIVVMAQAAPKLVPLGVEEMGYYGATDALTLEARDLTESVANVAQTNTVTLYGPCSWQFVGYKLDAPFDTTLVTNVMTCALTVSLDSTALVNGLQVATDQWRAYKNYVPIIITGTNVYAGTVTNGATATLTCIVGAPGAAHTLNKTDSGRARAFFRIWR
jgi:hypothetical protein